MNDVRATIREIIGKWQGALSVADTPAIALLTVQKHPGLNPGLCEHLVRTEIIDRALSVRRAKRE